MMHKLTVLIVSIISVFYIQNAYCQEKFALIIGNADYNYITKLNNPVNDAVDMAATLAKIGFQVDLIKNGSLDEMENGVIRLCNKISQSPGSYSLFYYAGHGIQANGINYLIPVDANIPAESFLRIKSLATQTVLDSLQQTDADLNVIVLDACRDNPFSWARSGNRGLSVIGTQPPNSIVVYATGAGSTAQDGIGRNGLFTEQLLKFISTPGIEVKEMFNRTGEAVMLNSNNKQIPAIYSQFFKKAYLAGELSSNIVETNITTELYNTPTIKEKSIVINQDKSKNVEINSITTDIDIMLDKYLSTIAELELFFEESNKYYSELKPDPWESDSDFLKRINLEKELFEKDKRNEIAIADKIISEKQWIIPSQYIQLKFENFDREKKHWIIHIESINKFIPYKGDIILDISSVPDIKSTYKKVVDSITSKLLKIDLVFTVNRDKNNSFLVKKIKKANIYIDKDLFTQYSINNNGYAFCAKDPLKQMPNPSIEMVPVEGGTYIANSNIANRSMMGWPKKHEVEISKFLIMKTEVTQDLFEQITKYNPSNIKNDKLPVSQVNWYEAIEFCNLISKNDGFEPVYTIQNRIPIQGYPIKTANVTCDWMKNGYRLPTSYEWQFASLGGKDSLGYNFPGSNDAYAVSWNIYNSGNKPHNSATLLPNELGIFDMAGNVQEWCWDYAYSGDEFPGMKEMDPKGPISGTSKVIMGGHYLIVPEWIQGDFNYYFHIGPDFWTTDNPSICNDYTGFRLARNIN